MLYTYLKFTRKIENCIIFFLLFIIYIKCIKPIKIQQKTRKVTSKTT